ncbi:MAG: DEAD/DEAH box helicase, partial [Nitrosopumilaceae archaeon]|nr:DEAD/DEAH box helicase [Nitrosopumilaceae archaeon]
MTEFIQHKFIRPDLVEAREYQVSLANQAKQENCLVVLPTGLGKTTVALLVIADYLSRGTGGVLFLAPTRVLTNQHYEFLKNNLNLEDIGLLTGEDTISRRKKSWANSVI